MSVLPARLPVDCRLLVVKSWSPKFYLDFQRPGGVGTCNPELFKGQRCTQWGFLSLLLPTRRLGLAEVIDTGQSLQRPARGHTSCPMPGAEGCRPEVALGVMGKDPRCMPTPLDPKRIPLPPCRLCLELHNSQTTGKGPRSPSTGEQAV